MDCVHVWIKDTMRWSAVTGLVLALGATWIWLSAVPGSETTGGLIPSPHQGFLAPDFKLDTLDGGVVTLSDLRGQAVVVNLWASWCPPCRSEMPALQTVYQTNKERGLTLLAVNMTYQDSEAAAAAFAQQFGLTFPILLDRTGLVGNLYQLRALPTTFFVDSTGVIQQVVIGGPMSEVSLQTAVETLLNEGS
jgi:cytochrome c biogenesis protein CcmG/thiol:disulfide interchange protein DsbE